MAAASCAMSNEHDGYMESSSVYMGASPYPGEERLYVIHEGVPYSLNGWRHKELMDRISALEKKVDTLFGTTGPAEVTDAS